MMDNDQTPQENPSTEANQEVNQEVTVTSETSAEPVAQTSTPAEEVAIVVNEAAIQAIVEANQVQIVPSPILTSFNTTTVNSDVNSDNNAATQENTDVVKNNEATEEESTSEVGSPSKKRLKI